MISPFSTMDKIFFYTLIGMLSIGVFSILELLHEYESLQEESSLALCSEMSMYNILFAAVCYLMAAIYFGYRFFPGKFFPILSIILVSIYLKITWSYCLWYSIDPISYISTHTSKWDSEEFKKSKEEIMRQYDCCGLTENQSINSPECSRRKVWSCSRAVALHKGRELRGKVWGDFMKSFFHIGTSLILWVTHLTGGIEGTFLLEGRKKNADQYSQM